LVLTHPGPDQKLKRWFVRIVNRPAAHPNVHPCVHGEYRPVSALFYRVKLSVSLRTRWFHVTDDAAERVCSGTARQGRSTLDRSATALLPEAAWLNCDQYVLNFSRLLFAFIPPD